jgi:hypothetical protein
MRKQTSDAISQVAKSVQTYVYSATKISRQSAIDDPLSLNKEEIGRLSTHKDIGLLLNLFKLSCESSFELLNALQSTFDKFGSEGYQAWRTLGDDIMSMLKFLEMMIGSKQRHIIIDMKASLLGTQGQTHTHLILFIIL